MCIMAIVSFDHRTLSFRSFDLLVFSFKQNAVAMTPSSDVLPVYMEDIVHWS